MPIIPVITSFREVLLSLRLRCLFFHSCLLHTGPKCKCAYALLAYTLKIPLKQRFEAADYLDSKIRAGELPDLPKDEDGLPLLK